MLTIQYSLFVSRSYRSEVSALAVRVSNLVLQVVTLHAGQEILSSLSIVDILEILDEKSYPLTTY